MGPEIASLDVVSALHTAVEQNCGKLASKTQKAGPARYGGMGEMGNGAGEGEGYGFAGNGSCIVH